jgi:hypothetical protein
VAAEAAPDSSSRTSSSNSSTDQQQQQHGAVEALVLDVGAGFGWYSLMAGMLGCRWVGQSCHVMLCCAVPCCARLCHGMPRHAVPCTSPAMLHRTDSGLGNSLTGSHEAPCSATIKRSDGGQLQQQQHGQACRGGARGPSTRPVILLLAVLQH